MDRPEPGTPGPPWLKALEDDRHERLVDGFLATAGIVFVDEVFQANSAILSALLMLLNEREFDNGSTRHHVPPIAVVTASEGLAALNREALGLREVCNHIHRVRDWRRHAEAGEAHAGGRQP